MTESVGASETIRLHLFGRFRVESGDGAVRLPTREARLLLGYLALHPEPHPRERLAALCWPEVPDPSARASLRNALSTLRRQLGAGLLVSDRKSVQLNPDFPMRVDAIEFRDRAGRFLDSPTPDPNAVVLDSHAYELLAEFYDDWVLKEREAYRDLYLKTLLELTQQMRSQGEYRRAVEFAERALACDPANERAHQHLMFCHVALGDRGAALRQFDACREALEEELAVAPSPATEHLVEWIRQAPLERLPVEAAITNLPIPATAFVGRQQEMTALKEQLGGARLVTLTGAGGSGKTRLAIQAVTDLLDAWRHGVWWVELAVLPSVELLDRTVAKTLGVPELPNQPIRDTLVNFLRSRELLLVLDNCEHLVDACADLVERLLAECPSLTILATSRERLGSAGEHVRPVPTLSVPASDEALPESELKTYQAVQLFVRRASAVNPEFRLTGENAPAVAGICRRLDGLPLAIELAAARANALGVEEINARLDDALGLLSTGRRTALPHHRTLRAAIEWSVGLLSEKEALLLHRLSVFAGGWTLPAAEAVCADGELEAHEIVKRHSGLVDKSLVEARAVGGETRYRMLETIRQYAHERLHESGAVTAIRTRHLHYFLQLVENVGAHMGFMLPDVQLDHWVGWLDPEQDNLRAAIRWTLHPEGLPEAERVSMTEAGLRLVSLQHAFMFARGRFSEWRARLDRLLEASASVPAATRALASLTAGYLACWQGDFEAGRAPFEKALALYRELEDDSGIGFALHGLGFVALGQGDAPRARSRFEDSLQVAREADDRWLVTFVGHFLGIVLSYQGDFDRAAACLEEGNALIRSLGGHRQAIAFSQFHLGRIARLRRDHAAARSHYAEGLRHFRKAGDRRGIGYSLAGFAVLAVAEGDAERAARLSGAMTSLEAVLGPILEAPLQIEYDRELASVRESLGDDAFGEAAAEGQSLTMDAAIEYALAH